MENRHASYVVINLALAGLSVVLSAGCFCMENIVLSYTKEKSSTIGCLTVDFIPECVLFIVIIIFFISGCYFFRSERNAMPFAELIKTVYSNMHMNYQPENLDEFIFLIAESRFSQLP